LVKSNIFRIFDKLFGMKGFIFVFILLWIWIAYEMWRAPHMDEQTGKIIKKAKRFKDLLKKQ